MAALSFCPNFSELPPLPEQATDTEMFTINDHNLLSYHESFIFPETYLNPFLDLDELFYFQSYTPTTNNIVSLSPEPKEEEALDLCFQFPKRVKTSYLPEYLCPNLDVFDAGYAGLPEVVPCTLVPEFEPPAMAEFAVGRIDEGEKKQAGGGGGGSLSAQSIAARERRRKITEKTQELGKLIPGGNKMNTAEMFQAAANYVKFLQAQSQLLQLMAKMEVSIPQELPILLASTTVQEKLYMQDKCLAPREVLESLAIDQELAPMAEEIGQLLGFDHSNHIYSNHIYLED